MYVEPLRFCGVERTLVIGRQNIRIGTAIAGDGTPTNKAPPQRAV
jgi:hypothetical protein